MFILIYFLDLATYFSEEIANKQTKIKITDILLLCNTHTHTHTYTNTNTHTVHTHTHTHT